MIEFKVKTTTYTVNSEESKSRVLERLSKIKKGTGKSTVPKGIKELNCNPTYPCFYEGMSTQVYVKAYEALNKDRGLSKFYGKLSSLPQFSQVDNTIIEFED